MKKKPTNFNHKYDEGKPDLQLVLGGFPRALLEVGHIGTKGATTHEPNSWKRVPEGQRRYTSALLRHWIAYCTGQNYDAESSQLHLAHMAWNALAILELYLQEEIESPKGMFTTNDANTHKRQNNCTNPS